MMERLLIGITVLALVGRGGHSSGQRSYAGCPYTGTPWGQRITGSEYDWAISTFGTKTVDHCWPGSS